MNTFLNTIWQVRPAASWDFMWLFTALLGISLIIAIIASLPIRGIEAWLKNQLSTWGITSVIVAGSLWFFRFGQVPYLGMEGWLWIWLIVSIIWISTVIVMSIMQRRSHKSDTDAVASYRERFLPKPKK